MAVNGQPETWLCGSSVQVGYYDLYLSLSLDLNVRTVTQETAVCVLCETKVIADIISGTKQRKSLSL